MAKCIADDPPGIFQTRMCLNAVSKNLSEKLVRLSGSDPQKCESPSCKTIKTFHELGLKISTNPECDSPLGALLDGTIAIGRLSTAFRQTATGRGFHAGEFVWTGAGSLVIEGQISGTTNVGTHRRPVFKACQKCGEQGVMEGRLCGRVTKTENPKLKDCQVVASYRISFKPSPTQGLQSPVQGVLEGVVICPCK